MTNIKPFIFLILAMMFVFIIGLYASSHFKFNEHIELRRWAISIFFMIFFITLFFKNYKNQE